MKIYSGLLITLLGYFVCSLLKAEETIMLKICTHTDVASGVSVEFAFVGIHESCLDRTENQLTILQHHTTGIVSTPEGPTYIHHFTKHIEAGKAALVGKEEDPQHCLIQGKIHSEPHL